jgi:hypothetical protein
VANNRTIVYESVSRYDWWTVWTDRRAAPVASDSRTPPFGDSSLVFSEHGRAWGSGGWPLGLGLAFAASTIRAWFHAACCVTKGCA